MYATKEQYEPRSRIYYDLQEHRRARCHENNNSYAINLL